MKPSERLRQVQEEARQILTRPSEVLREWGLGELYDLSRQSLELTSAIQTLIERLEKKAIALAKKEEGN